jgi:protocatechuate 3,4-dioxygenase beta subunit
METNRRNFLRLGASLTAAGLLPKIAEAQTSPVCRPTAPQTEGPFYPIDRQIDEDADLTYVRGSRGKAQGQVVYLHGTVVGNDCQPVAGALVEIWQACVSGRYNHPSDPNTAPLDPNFQYWGKAVTSAQGQYLFKTIIPGAYPAAPGWNRPPHLHVKVSRLGYHELTSQMYFAGHALNGQDRILMSLPPQDRAGVIVAFAPAPATEGYEPRALRGNFPITLRKA